MIKKEKRQRYLTAVLISLIGLFILIHAISTLIINASTDVITEDNSRDVSTKCKNIETMSTKLQCWEVLFTNILEKKHTAEAFQLISDLSTTDATFSSNCHDFAHRIGEVSALTYIQQKNISFPEKASYCGYGFYHGFMGYLLKNKIPVKNIALLCQQIKKTQPLSVEDACYHGIGHGSFALSSSEIRNNPEKAIEKALQTCEEIEDTTLNVSRCASGIFMEVTSGEYKVKLDQTHPLNLCYQQKERYQIHCFTQMNGALLAITNNNYIKAARYIEEIPSDHYAIEAIETLTANYILSTKDNLKSVVIKCKQLQDRIYISCIRGIALGTLLDGVPEAAFNKAVKYCLHDLDSEDTKNSCLEYTLQHGKYMYDKNQLDKFCDSLLKEEDFICDNINIESYNKY